MAQNEIDLSGKTVEELDALIQQARDAKSAKQALSTISYIGAFEASLKVLQERLGETHPKLMEIKQAWFPKPTYVAKKADVSETMRDNALEKGRKAIASL